MTLNTDFKFKVREKKKKSVPLSIFFSCGPNPNPSVTDLSEVNYKKIMNFFIVAKEKSEVGEKFECVPVLLSDPN